MPIYMPSDTRGVLGETAARCDSRSLLMDRFADPAAKDSGDRTPRRDWFNRLLAKSPVRFPLGSWVSQLTQAQVIYAQLQSRLMVNMAGGVMENAGLCLDRFGMPYIPGSAVKGCARRMALAALREWCEAGTRPKGDPPGPEDPVAICCALFATPADMLVAIARTFGWADQDWSDRPDQSDFAWACCGDWPTTRETVVRQLATQLGVSLKPDDPKPWKNLPNFAGSVSFLPAYPVDVTAADLPLKPPPLGQLELDVVTCHHPEYYRGKRQVATDDEDPNPVVFPAVAPGHVFAFVLAPLRRATGSLLDRARTWLTQGLETFGLGAKTNAGYGWFDCSDQIQTAVSDQLRKRAEAEEKRRRDQEEQMKAKAAEEERLRKKRELEAKLKDLTPEQQEDYKLDQMSEDQLNNHLLNYSKLSELQQAAVYRLLKDRQPDLWRKLRQLSETGKKKEKKRWTPLVQDMFKRAKQQKEKMPK